MDPIPVYGWATVAAIALALVATWLVRRWRKEDARATRITQAEADYRAANLSGDPDRIAIAARRLLDARHS